VKLEGHQVVNHNQQSSATRHLVWVYGNPIDKLDAATWIETSSELCRLGWRVTLVASGSAGEQFRRGVRVLCIPTPQVYFLRQSVFHLRLLCLLAREWNKADVILFHQMSAPWILPLRAARRLMGRRYPLLVMDTRDLDVPDVSVKKRLRLLYCALARLLANRWADGQTAITQRMADLVRIPPQQLWGVWESGVNLERFAFAQTARRWPSDGEPIHLIYIGALLHERNLLPLCQAVEEVNAEGMKFVLSLIGTGLARADLERFALQTNGHIRVIPPVPHNDVPQWLAQAHIGVTSIFAPEQEIFQASSPIKLFEYMAAGLPVLATRTPCHTDVVRDGEYVFWVERADVPALTSALRLAWRNQSALREMGNQAATAAQIWSWRVSAEKLKAALEYGLTRGDY